MLAARNSSNGSSNKTVELLLTYGANINLKDKDGCSALMLESTARYLAWFGDCLILIAYL
jgi:ankyrin repeat protein